MIYSKKYTLHLIDWVKGFVVACLTGGLTAVTDTLTSGALPGSGNLKAYIIASLLAGIAYIIKNFLTNSEGKLAKEPKKYIQ